MCDSCNVKQPGNQCPVECANKQQEPTLREFLEFISIECKAGNGASPCRTCKMNNSLCGVFGMAPSFLNIEGIITEFNKARGL